uniref:Alcohol dehydrogenase NADP+ A n=1 Tax=Ascaris suum TaxID=6253 RepID=F1L674_ASCSU
MTVGGPMLTLSNGRQMPQVGLGTWMSYPHEVAAAVRWALDAGYRLIDTATCYGNEKEIGDVLHEYLSSGKIKREELFVTTKLWCTHNRPSDIEGQIKESLAKLQLDYVDLYLVHMPAAFNHEMTQQDHSVTLEQVWTGLEAVYEKGLTKAIGLSNVSIEQVERVQKSAKVKIHNVQVECYLYFPQYELAEVCKKHNISFTAYGPLGSPGRVNWTLPSGAKLVWAEAKNPLENELVVKLATKYKKTSAQILLRHLLQRGLAIIPKSVHESRIKENFDIFDFELTDEEMKELNDIKHRQRLFLQDFMEGHPEDPFKDERKATA